MDNPMFAEPTQPDQTVMNRLSIATQNMPKDRALEWLKSIYDNVEGMMVAIGADLGVDVITPRDRLQHIIDVHFSRDGYSFPDGEWWGPTKEVESDPNVMRTTF